MQGIRERTMLSEQDQKKLAEIKQRLENQKTLAKRSDLENETHLAYVGGSPVYVRVGLDANRNIQEIFIDAHKEHETVRGLLNCFSIIASTAIGAGVPLTMLVDKFLYYRSQPNGEVKGSQEIREASSILDYVFRQLAITYLERADLIQKED